MTTGYCRRCGQLAEAGTPCPPVPAAAGGGGSGAGAVRLVQLGSECFAVGVDAGGWGAGQPPAPPLASAGERAEAVYAAAVAGWWGRDGQPPTPPPAPPVDLAAVLAELQTLNALLRRWDGEGLPAVRSEPVDSRAGERLFRPGEGPSAADLFRRGLRDSVDQINSLGPVVLPAGQGEGLGAIPPCPAPPGAEPRSTSCQGSHWAPTAARAGASSATETPRIEDASE